MEVGPVQVRSIEIRSSEFRIVRWRFIEARPGETRPGEVRSREVRSVEVRCGVDPFATLPTHPKSRGKTTHPLLARCSRRHLLRTQEWLSLAAFAPRLPSVVYRLLSLQEISS